MLLGQFGTRTADGPFDYLSSRGGMGLTSESVLEEVAKALLNPHSSPVKAA
jgi:hypothetical protein